MKNQLTATTIELVVPDRAVSIWKEHIRIGDEEVVIPQNAEISQWGASVCLDGLIYTANQEAMEGYPNAGSYYLNSK
jgi:hypothetical protein